MTGTSFILSILVIWSIKDTKIEQSKQKFSEEVKEYLMNIKLGFAQFRLPKLWLYIPIIMVVQGLFYATGWGLLRLILLDRFHFDPILGSIAVATSSLITVGILAIMHRYAESMSEKKVIVLISLSAAASLLLSLADIGKWGYFVILALYAGEHVLHPFISEILNKHAVESQRATVLSVSTFLRALPYIALAPVIGYLNTVGKLEYLLLGWSFLIFIAILFYLLTKKKDEKISLIE